MAKRGPKTEEGKAAVSFNAVRHGVLSTTPVIPGLEREEDWQAHRTGVLSSLTPEGYLEMALADRVALLLWRLRRIARYESAIIDSAQRRIPEDLIEAGFNEVDAKHGDEEALEIEGVRQLVRDLFKSNDTPVATGSARYFISVVAEEAQVKPDEVDLPDPLKHPYLDLESSGECTTGLIREGLRAIAAHAGREEGELLTEALSHLLVRLARDELDVKKVSRERERRALERLLPDEENLGKVIRYESHLHRQLLQTMHELEALQARRQGRQTPLARVDVQGLADQ